MASFIIVFALLAALCCVGIIGKKPVNVNALTALSKEETCALRGVAMLIIVFSHLADPSIHITFFFYVSGALGVAVCFLVSGYGLGKGCQNKDNYLSHFLLFKFLRCLLPYFALYLIYAVLFMPDGRTIISEVGRLQMAGRMAGSLLWYLKVQLLLYLFFFFSFRFAQHTKNQILILTGCCILYCVIVWLLKAESFWYKTCLFFPLGVWLSFTDRKILPLLRKRVVCFSSACICLFMYVVIYFVGRMGMELVIDGIYMLSFVLFLLGISPYLKGSYLLNFIGSYSIEVYLIHCLILALAREYFPGTRAVSYISITAVVFLLSIPLKWICDKCMGAVKSRISDKETDNDGLHG